MDCYESNKSINDNRFRTSNVYGNKLGIILMGTSGSIFAFDSVDTNIMYNRTSDKRFKFEKQVMVFGN